MQRRIVTLLVVFALTWAGMAALYSQTPPAPRVGCKVDQPQISTGSSTRFIIFVDQIPPLTAFNLTVSYDPNALQFQDQDLTTIDVINLAAGSAFPATSFSQNSVNPVNGQIQLAVSQPISSTIDGNFAELATGTLSGINQAVAPFRFSAVTLYDHNSLLMNRATYAVEECFVEVGNSGAPTPTSTATYFLSPLLTATPTPPGFTSIAPTVTPTPTQMPTFTPGPTSPLATPENTATPTFTPLPTATPTDTDTPQPTPTDTDTPTATVVVYTNPAGLDNNRSPVETPTPPVEETPTESPVPPPTETETPTETPISTDTPMAEVVPPTETPMPLPTPTDTPTLEPPPTPTSPFQTDRALGETVEVVAQSTPSTRPAQQPYRLLAVAALFGGLALLLAFWQLRRRGD